ncbi:MAG TPA: hypothetical protein VF713_18875 [Thermoanaerobaculia bacterium]
MSVGDNDDSASRKVVWKDFKLNELTRIMDVVYGVVLAYGAALVMPMFQDWITNGNRLAGLRACNIAFVLNYAIADFIEARVVTGLVPYEGKGRFSLDLLIAMLFLGALQAAASATATGPQPFLVCLALAFFAAAIWAAIFKYEERGRLKWGYAGCVVATHVAAGIVCLVAYWMLDTTHGLWFAVYVWTGYVAWLIMVSLLKLVAGVPETGFDLLPFSLVGLAIYRLGRAVRSPDETG